MNASILLRVWVLAQLVFSFALSAATHPLTIAINGSGAVSTNPTATAYPHNSTVTLTANPAAGWQFTGWSGDISGTLNPTNVLMDANKSITANFAELPQYTLTVNVSGNGNVVPNGGSYPSNSTVHLQAQPAPNGVFHHWSGDAAGSSTQVNVTMNANKAVTAVFIQPLTITQQPQDTSAAPGGTASFCVGASGNGPLTYAWQFNGSPLPGADNSTLALANVQLTAAGSYRAVVTSPYSSATSSVATLTVSCPGTNVVSVASDAALRAAMAVGGNVRLCFNGTVTLTNTIVVTKDTTLDASGVNVVLSGGNSVRLFTVISNVAFGLTNLALINGSYTDTNFLPSGGGAILSTGALQLTSCVFSNNFVCDAYGGAVACLRGSLVATNCAFVGNIGRGSVASPAKSVYGGAVYLSGDATAVLTDSLFLSNSLASDSAPTNCASDRPAFWRRVGGADCHV